MGSSKRWLLPLTTLMLMSHTSPPASELLSRPYSERQRVVVAEDVVLAAQQSLERTNPGSAAIVDWRDIGREAARASKRGVWLGASGMLVGAVIGGVGAARK